MHTNLGRAVLQYVRTLVVGRPTEGCSDAALLEQFIRRRSEAAFAAILERHGSMVLSVCRSIVRDEHLAEDAFQATFLVLARKADSIRKREALASWLYGAALRLARKLHTQHQRSERLMGPAVPPAHEPAAARYEDHEILHEELQRLPERYRLPLVLCYFQGRTHNEAAVQFGWSTGKLKGLLERGRERLRSRLVRRGVTLSSAAGATLLTDVAVPAAVPPVLAAATVKAALLFAAGKTLAETGVAASAASLAEGGLQMIGSKKVGLVVLLALVASTVGAGVALLAMGQGKPPDDKQARQSNPPAPAPIEKESAVLPDQAKPQPNLFPMPDPEGDTLPTGAVAMLGSRRFSPAGSVSSLSVSADGKYLAAVAVAGAIVAGNGWTEGDAVWAASGKRLCRLPTFGTCLTFTPDGSTLCIADARQSTIRLFDPLTGKERRQQASTVGHRGQVFGLAFAPHGKTVISTDSDGVTCWWDLKTGKQTQRVPEETAVPFSPESVRHAGIFLQLTEFDVQVAFSPDGGKLLCGSDSVRDVVTGKEVARLRGEQSAQVAAFGPDGKTVVSAARDGATVVWDLVQAKPVSQLPKRFMDGGETVGLSADGSLLVVARQYFRAPYYGPHECGIWDTATGKEVLSFQLVNAQAPRKFIFSQDKKLLIAGLYDGMICILDARTGRELRRFQANCKDIAVQALALSPDGTMIASNAVHHSFIRVWDVQTGKEIHRFSPPSDPQFKEEFVPGRPISLALAFSPDSTLLASDSADSAIILWDVRKKQPDAK